MCDKSCRNCIDFKEYVNERKMSELGITSRLLKDIIWFYYCQNPETHGEIKDLNIANNCQYYDDDSWIK